MDAVRNFAQTNRSSVINVIYIVAAAILIYYIVMYFFGSGSELKDKYVQKTKIEASGLQGKTFEIGKSGDTKFRAGNEYTVSFWIYINSYGTTGTTPMGIMALFDENLTDKSFLYVGLHPNQPKMIIRPDGFNPAGDASDEYNKYTTTTSLSPGAAPVWGGTNAAATTDIDALTPCDIMDVDIQRWINVTISVSGRIMDVYMDGKLARSCIMQANQQLSTGQQLMYFIPNSEAFNGYVSGVVFSNYAITPDAVYARYQSGPYSGTGFLDYLIDKLGIRITYTDNTDATSEFTLASFLPFKPSS